MRRFVVNLRSRRALRETLAGGKGAGLARLARGGFRVPPGFVITTEAFRVPLRNAFEKKGEGMEEGSVSSRESLESARSSLMSWPFPLPLEKAIRAAYHRLGGPVAVRSSLVGEDSGAGSFAGQLDTFLGVVGPDAVIEAVRKCLASTANDRFWAYLGRQGRPRPALNPDDSPTIPSDAGMTAIKETGLTSDTGERSGAIPEAQPSENPGPISATTPDASLGSSPVSASDVSPALPSPAPRPSPHALALAVVVQSMVPARVSGVAFSADPVSGQPDILIEAVPGLGEDLVQGRIQPDRYRLDPRGHITECAEVRSGSPALSEDAVRSLADTVYAIASRSGDPQDVEWSWDGSGFHILQARPIASLAGKPLFSRRMVSDMAPGLVKPLVWSAKYAPIIHNVFAVVFERILGRTGVDYSRLSARFHSRVYMNVTLFGQLFARIGLPANFFEFLARGDRAARTTIRFHLRMLPIGFNLFRHCWRESRVGRRVGSFLETQNLKLEQYRTSDWAAQSPQTLLRFFHRLMAIHGDAQRYVINVSVNMLIRNRILGRMIKRQVPGADPGDVIKGYGRRGGLAPFEEMKKLARTARRVDPGLLEKIATGADIDLETALESSLEGRDLLEAFERFMVRYGFLSANGSDFSEIPWIENPRLVWRSVARMATAPGGSASEAAESHRRILLEEIRGLMNPVRRGLFDRLHRSTVRFMEWRDQVSFLMTEDSYLMRRCVLALGAKLTGLGALREPEDIFYLDLDEIEDCVLDTWKASETPAALAAARKAELAADAEIEPPETICGECGRPQPPSVPKGTRFLAGIGGSGGVVRGRARIVHDPAIDGRHLGRGDILVVPFTDIGWTPVLAEVGGIVAETGGLLSHSSIIAREFGIPAVVSVRHATVLIGEGQEITVDGKTGRVHLCSDSLFEGGAHER